VISGGLLQSREPQSNIPACTRSALNYRPGTVKHAENLFAPPAYSSTAFAYRLTEYGTRPCPETAIQ
jgi:hypothetical protein